MKDSPWIGEGDANTLTSLPTVIFSRKKIVIGPDCVRDRWIRQLIKYEGVNDRIGGSKSSRVG